MLTEKDAWRLLSAIWLKPNAFAAATVDNTGCIGLCACINILVHNGHISKRVSNRMYSRIEKEGKSRGRTMQHYLWPPGDTKSRAEFCETQANRRSLWSFFR